jgi:23S rRNA (guanine1835-N2)-methyltransferase
MNSDHLSLNIKRYDLSDDKSLKASSAADELILKSYTELNSIDKPLAIYNDRFGYLRCHLNHLNPTSIFTNKSQLNSIESNCNSNRLVFNNCSDPLTSLENKIDLAVLRMPKSLALFELYLQHISKNSTPRVQVIVGYMTKYFSPKMIEIAEKYFSTVEQSRAVKKARVATLSGKRMLEKAEMIDFLAYNNRTYRQYWGVFSAKHIDYATQYFLKHIKTTPKDLHILDLASGNGVIANELLKILPNSTFHLIDDSFLAVESAKLNVAGENVHHYFENNLSTFTDHAFDLIVSNPPFHFEHEINIQIPIQLFKECYRCLKPGGNLQMVANNHLNYSSQLKKIFPTVETVAQNESFVVIRCQK